MTAKRARRDLGGSRLVIDSLEFENFKSYLGVKHIGPFHNSLSCIIGPNGSGKSNIIDGLLFVFGKRAKRIRLNRMSELIYSGPCPVPPQSARVTVHFCEVSDDESSTESRRVTVTRSVLRNNSTSYQLNGRVCTWTELQGYFVEKGIDLEHNRFLILQGEVEQIAMMKPIGSSEHEEGLLEYLEDLIGSSQYVKDIAVTRTELETHKNERDTALARQKVADKEVASLEEPRKQAQLHIGVMGRKCFAQAMMVQIERQAERGKLADLETALTASRTHLKNKREEGKTLAEHKEQERQKCQTDRAQFDKINALVTRLNEAVSTKDDEKRKLKMQLERYTDEKKKRETEQKQHIDKLLKQTADMQQVQTSRQAAETDCAESKAVLTAAQEQYKQLLNKADLGDYDANKKTLLAEMGKCETAIRETSREVEEHKARIESLRKTQLDFGREKDKLGEDMEKDKSRKLQLANEQQQVARTRDAIEAKLRELRDVQAQTQKTVGGVRTELTKAEQKLNTMARVFDKQGTSIRTAVMDATREAGNQAWQVYGTVSDFVDADERFRVALSTALGNTANSLIVQTEQDSKRIFEFLRNNRIGRTQCIVLSQLRLDSADAQMPPEGAACQRLIDVVRVSNAQVLPAIKHALRNTLVAENIRQATSLAAGGRRFRIVTLQGELVEPSGAMTGGGTAAGPKEPPVSREQMDEVRRQTEELKEQFERGGEQVRKLREQIDDLASERMATDTETRRLATEIRYAEDDVIKWTRKLAALKERFPEAAQATMLEEQLATSETKLEKAHERKKESTQKLDKLENAVAKRVGPKAVELRTLIEETKDLASAAEEKLQKYNRSIAKIKAQSVTHEEKIKELEQEQVKYEDKIEEARAAYQAMLTILEETLKEFKNAKETLDTVTKQMAEHERKFSAIEAKLKILANAISSAQEEVVAATTALEKVKAVVDQHSKELNKVREQFKKLPLDLLEDSQQDLLANDPSNAALAQDLPEDVLQGVDVEQAKNEFLALEVQVNRDQPNLKVIDDYRAKHAEQKLKKAEFEAISAARDDCKRRLDELEKKRLDDFNAGFMEIASKLKELYQMLTLGGDAELEFVDPSSPFTKGIAFSVRPPKKSWKQISNLSGGEKTLSSLSLVFALHHFRPTPLYFLDEIDAALDSHNVQIIANYLKERARGAQFIVISLRNHMFEIADWLVGVFKTNNQSKSLAIDPRNPSLLAPLSTH